MAFPTFRELAAAVVRGVDVVSYLEYHRGTWHGGPYDMDAHGFAPICVPVATQIVHAVGWSLGAKLDGSGAVALAYFGDGSASEGDFHEGANMAAVWRTPTILFCQNNGWAISVPLAQQTVAPIAAPTAMQSSTAGHEMPFSSETSDPGASGLGSSAQPALFRRRARVCCPSPPSDATPTARHHAAVGHEIARSS